MTLIARQPEFWKLDDALASALRKEGQLRFLIGEAGTGKTSLLKAYATHAENSHPEIVTVLGTCDFQSSKLEPYLPFRDILKTLTLTLQKKLDSGPEQSEKVKRSLAVACEILLEQGPDLIGTFVPLGKLIASVATAGFKKTPWFAKLEQMQVRKKNKFEVSSDLDATQLQTQCVNVLISLSEAVPLLILLDDLQWADEGSIDLLFRLARRLEGSQIMVIGSFRPEELNIAEERHPLSKVITELKRYNGSIDIDLDKAVTERSDGFVSTLLDQEAHKLPNDFKDFLVKQTGGNPLFLVELLRSMQQQGTLYKDNEGYWLLKNDVHLQEFPGRIEGVIQERIQRLDDDLKQTLTFSSVEGEIFSAEIVASLEKRQARATVATLSGPLQQEHKLIDALDVERIGNQRVSRYKFSSHLLREYVYKNIDEVERSYLHEDVGNALEELYREDTNDVALQLAWHFEESQLLEKSAYYLIQLSKETQSLHHHTEALELLDKALDFTTATNKEQFYEILMLKERSLDVLGKRELQAKVLEQLTKLDLADVKMTAQITKCQGWYYLNVGDFQKGIECADRLTGLNIDDALGLEAILLKASAYSYQGKFKEAQSFLTSVNGQNFENNKLLQAQYLNTLGIVEYQCGDYTAANGAYSQALTVLEAEPNLRLERRVVNNLGVLHMISENHVGGLEHFKRALQLAKKIGSTAAEADAYINLASLLCTKIGRFDKAFDYVVQSQKLNQELQEPSRSGENNLYLSKIFLGCGDVAVTKETLEIALVDAVKLDDKMLLFWCYEVSVQLSLATQNLNQAQKDLSTLKALAQELDSPLEVGRYRLLLTMFLIQHKKFDKAQQVLLRARETFETLQLKDSILFCHLHSLYIFRLQENSQAIKDLLSTHKAAIVDILKRKILGTDFPFHMYIQLCNAMNYSQDIDYSQEQDAKTFKQKVIEPRMLGVILSA